MAAVSIQVEGSSPKSLPNVLNSSQVLRQTIGHSTIQTTIALLKTVVFQLLFHEEGGHLQLVAEEEEEEREEKKEKEKKAGRCLLSFPRPPQDGGAAAAPTDPLSR